MSNKRKQQREAERAKQPQGNVLAGLQPGRAGGAGGRSSHHEMYLLKLHRIKEGLGLSDQPGADAGHSIPAAVRDGGDAGPAVLDPVAIPDLADIPEVIQSRAQKDLIWEEALANKEYYESKALEDDLKKPWFQYPKKRTQYGEFVFVTPDMAEELLRFNPDNRNVSDGTVQMYRDDIENDQWVPSHEAIGINLSGNMFDGQHRAIAVVEANKGWPLWIVWNVLDEAKFVADSGKKRSSVERIEMVTDLSLGSRTAGFVAALMRGTATRARFSDSDKVQFALKWQHVTDWIGEHLPNTRADVQAAVAKAVIWYGEEKLKPFCNRFKKLQFSGDGDPAKALYIFLQRAKAQRSQNPLVTYKKTLAAITALMEDKTVAKLYEQDDDIFPWLPGWEVPPGSPRSQKEDRQKDDHPKEEPQA